MKNETPIYMYIDEETDKINIEKVANYFSPYLWKIITNSGIINQDEINDIISDSYLILWKASDKLERTMALSPYLVGIVKILIKKHLKFYYKERINENLDDYEFMLDDKVKIEIDYENIELIKKILEILGNLKKEDKYIFVDYYLNEYKIKEIAYRYNLTESNIKTKLHRLRKFIKRELKKGGYINND